MNGKVTIDLSKRTITPRQMLWNCFASQSGIRKTASLVAGKSVEITISPDRMMARNRDFGIRKEIPRSGRLAGELTAAGVLSMRFNEAHTYDDVRSVLRYMTECDLEGAEWMLDRIGFDLEKIESPKCEKSDFPVTWSEFYPAAVDLSYRKQVDNGHIFYYSCFAAFFAGALAFAGEMSEDNGCLAATAYAVAGAMQGLLAGFLVSSLWMRAKNAFVDRHNCRADAPGIFSPVNMVADYEALKKFAVTGANVKRVGEIISGIRNEKLIDRLLSDLPRRDRAGLFCEASKATNRFSLDMLRKMAKEELLTPKQKASALYKIFVNVSKAQAKEGSSLIEAPGQGDLAPSTACLAAREAADIINGYPEETKRQVLSELGKINMEFMVEVLAVLGGPENIIS